MSRKRTDPLRRILTVEALEDRRVLSGNVTVFMLPELPGELIILDDKEGNHLSINAEEGVLTVSGSADYGPGTEGTTINGGASASFPLSSVDEININNPALFGTPDMVNGNNFIQMSGFTIPGNIVMDFGAGHNMVRMNKISAQIVEFQGTFGGGRGSDTITTNNSVEEASTLLPGSGTNVMSYTHDTIGLINVQTPVNSHNQTLQVLNCNDNPPQQPATIGALIAALSPGTSTGNNTITIAGDTIGMAQIQSGDHTAGNRVRNTVAIANDTVTGSIFGVALENGSGQNNGTADASVNNFNSTGVFFSTGGTYETVIDDGPIYVAGDGTVGTASRYSQTLTNGTGSDVIALGRNFQNITAGITDSGTDTNDIDTNNFLLTAWPGADRVKVNVDATGDAQVGIDQAASTTIFGGNAFARGLPAPIMTIVGTVHNDLNIVVGDNWALTVSPINVGGNLFIDPPSFSTNFPAVSEPPPPIAVINNPANGLNVTVTSAKIGGILQIYEGQATPDHLTQSVTVGSGSGAVTTTDLEIVVASMSNNGPVGYDAFLTITNTSVTDNSGLLGMFVQDNGSGNDLLKLGGGSGASDPLGIGGGALTLNNSVLEVLLSSGNPFNVNLGYAENVTALVVLVDVGGSPASDLFEHNVT